MRIGISTGCLYPMSVYDSIYELTEAGFKVFEIFFNTFSDLENDCIDKLKARLDTFDAEVVSVHPFTSSFESFLLFSDYKQRFFDGVNFYEMFFRAAQKLGAKRVVLHGLTTAYQSKLSDSEYFSRFAVLQQRAACYGVELIQENVNRFRSGDPAFIRKMTEEIHAHCAFVCDTKQARLCGISASEMTDAMGSSLKQIHISDHSGENSCLLPGKGCFDTEGFLRHLKLSGFDGELIIEVYRFSYGDQSELTDARVHLQAIIERL